MTKEQQEIHRLELEKKVIKQYVEEFVKKLSTVLEVITEEEQTKDERIKNLRGILDGYHHKVKCQEKEIEELKTTIAAQNADFETVLDKRLEEFSKNKGVNLGALLLATPKKGKAL